MKKIKKFVAIALSACMVCTVPAFLAGCNDGDDGSDAAQTEGAVKIKDIADMSLKVDETKTLTLSEYITANGDAVTVSSAVNGSVLTVSESGGVITLCGKAKGVATVIVKCGTVVLSFQVTVTEANVTPAPVFEDLEKSVDLNDGALEVSLAPKSGGEKFNITYTLANDLITGAEIEGNKLTFTPSAKGYVEISVNASCESRENAQNVYDLNFKVKITVTENVVPVYYTVVIDGEERQVEHGATLKLPDRPKQEIESGKEFKGWQVGQEVKSGGSVITVTGHLEITAVIEDEPEASPEKIKNGTDISFLLSENSATVSVAEYITTNGHAVSVSSSEEGVATVSESSGAVTITAVAAGKTEVKLICKDIEITFDVTVKNAAPTFDDGTMSIDLYSPTGTYEIKPHGASTFTYAYSVSGATVSSEGVLTYTASDIGTQTLTVNVTATDSATDEVERTTFTVTVTVFDTTACRIVNGGFEDGLNGWTISALDGSAFEINADWNVVQNTDAYWSGSAAYNNTGYHFNGLDGGIPETLTYKLMSTPFTIGGSGYISYKIGGRAAVVKIYDNATGVLLAEFANTAWADKDEPVGCIKDGRYNLTLLPYFADLSAYKGLEVYLVLEDALGSGWGHSVMDEVVTYYDKAPTTAKYDEVIEKCSVHYGQTAIINWIKATNLVPVNRLQITDKIQNAVADSGTANLTSYLSEADGKLAGNASATIDKQIVKVQEGDSVYTEDFTAFNLVAGKQYTVTYKLVSGEYEAEATFVISVKDNYQIVNGNFETGDLTGWTVVSGNIDLSGGISGEAYHEWDEHMPYNKSGEYFCKNAGVAEGEAWELKSSAFILSGNGHISFKMGSHNAVVKVFLADGTQIYEYTCKTYHADDAAFPHFEQGANYITMLTHYADLTAYKGQELYITIGNNGNSGGWNFAHFDDIVTYYAEGEDMSAKKDNVLLTCTGKDVTHNDGETLEVAWIIAENEYNN